MSEEYLDQPIPKDLTTGDQYEIVIKTTIIVEQTVPISSTFYPDEETIGDAVKFERNQSMPDKIETFTENLSNRLGDEVTFDEVITVRKVQRKSG